MAHTSNGTNALLRVVNILKEISMDFDPSISRNKHPDFPTFAEGIAKLFIDDRLFDILPRLELELKIVGRHSPPVRPAMDPYTSTQIGVFSKSFSDTETGHFLDYPDCCIKSFSEEVRYGLDERHAEELKNVKGKAFVTTAGFVPCSVFCKEAHAKALVCFVEFAEIKKLKALEKELSEALPHFHSEYQGHYFEIKGE